MCAMVCRSMRKQLMIAGCFKEEWMRQGEYWMDLVISSQVAAELITSLLVLTREGGFDPVVYHIRYIVNIHTVTV